MFKTYSIEKTKLSEIYKVWHDTTRQTNERILVSPKIVVNCDVEYWLAAKKIRQLCQRIIYKKSSIGNRRIDTLQHIQTIHFKGSPGGSSNRKSNRINRE